MIWAMILGLLLVVLAVLVLVFKVPRGSYEALGAVLMLALAGYAWQGRPEVAAAPRLPDETVSGRAAAEIEARQAMASPQRPGMDGGNAAMITADALLRHAQFADAAGVLRVAVERNPNDSDAWLGMGNALMGHAQGRLTPAALVAYHRASLADPAAPGPPFFLGMAYAQQGDFAEARRLWTGLMARTPADAPWRPQLTAALARLDRITAVERAAGRPGL